MLRLPSRLLALAPSIIWLVCSSGCDSATRELASPTARADGPVTPELQSGAPDRLRGHPSPEKPATPPPAPRANIAAPTGALRTAYDFAAHVDHAELRRGDSLIINFGEPGDVKYSLGGWGTRVIRGAQVDGVSAAFVRGSYGDALLSVQQKGALVIEARVRAPRDGDVTVYLDDQVATRTKLTPDAFATVRIDVPDGKLALGEHMLRLRGSGMGHIGPHSTAIAIDWVAVGPTSVGDFAPPAERALVPAPGKLAIASGNTLGYAFEVAPGARFVTDVAQGQLTLRAVTDALTPSQLAQAKAGQKIDVDLAQFVGKVIRLDLVATAGSGDVTLDRPRVMAPLAGTARTLQKPVKNVLVYLIDTLRADHLKPFNDSTRVRTPGLDELVGKGSAVFAGAHTQENWTKPSVATLLSSLYPWEHHAVTTEAVVPTAVDLLPEMLKKNDFYSGAFIANGYVSDKFGFKQGWDTWRNYVREGRYNRAEFLAADAVEWLDKRPESRPFFLYMHAIDPHVPYKPTAQFMHIYDPDPYSGVVDFSGDNELLEKIKIGHIKLNPRDKVHLEALYDSEISYHDLHFRTVLQALEKRGIADDTMIVVVADHGEEFWDHGSVGHGHSVYEELLRIPMVIRIPSLTSEPMHISSTSGLVDVLPTVLEALNLPIPPGVSGRSLMPELRGDTLDAPRVTVSGFMDGWRTAAIGHHKLIQRTEKRVIVHDLANDPHEQTDIVTQHPLTARYLRGQLGLALAASEQAGSSDNSSKKAIKGENTTIDKTTEAQLRELGYVGTSRR